jgi:predicted DNA-binding transcriptional regulator YafY
MQINRLFEIVYLLLNKKRVTANELAEHFEVSKRTILRDIDILTIAGIPIYTAQGKGGGIAILDNFVLDKATISDEEQNQILLALQSLASTQHADSSELLSKLSALFDKTDTNWIEVDFSRWGNTEPDRERFEILKRAILKKQAVTFTYSSSYGETSSRTVYPLKLAFKSKAWYLQAYCLSKNDYRTFKISRMLSVELTQNSFAGEEFTPAPIEPSDLTSPALVHLKLCFAPYAAHRVYDEFDTKNVAKNEDGSFTVIADLPNDAWLYGFLLSFGTAVKVVEPASVKDTLLAQAREIINSYLPDKT